MTKVLFDIRPLLEPRRSGVGNYTLGLMRALLSSAEPGIEFIFAANAAGRHLPDETTSLVDPQRHTISLTRWPNRLLNAGVATTGWPRLEDLHGDAAAVYLPNLNFAATRRPLIVTVHDLSFIRRPESFSPRQRLWHAAIRPAALFRRATHLVAVSEHTKADLIDLFGLAPEKITVINPGLDAGVRPAAPEVQDSLRNKFGLSRPYFLYLGNLEPRKNIPSLLSAFEKMPDATELVIAGGRGWGAEKIFRQAAQSPARERIRFLDYVAAADRAALYSAALALVYPSFYEGFGLPPLEAMACGTPVIVSHATSLPQTVGAAGLLVDPYDIDSIAEGMKAVLDEPALRARLSAAGPAQAAKFSWQDSARRLLGVFGQVTK